MTVVKNSTIPKVFDDVVNVEEAFSLRDHKNKPVMALFLNKKGGMVKNYIQGYRYSWSKFHVII